MAKKSKKKKQIDPSESNLIDITRRKFRWSDFLAEKIIKGVAFLSITIIVLIFVFVFRESVPIFASSEAKSHTEIAENNSDQQETYGAVTDQPAEPEVQETYGVVTDDQPAEPEQQETYGVVTEPMETQEQ